MSIDHNIELPGHPAQDDPAPFSPEPLESALIAESAARKAAEGALRQIITSTRSIYWTAEARETRAADGVLTTLWDIQIPYEDLVKLWFPVDVQPGQTFSDAWHLAIPAEDKKEMYAATGAALAEGRNGYAQEYRVISGDGAVIWISEKVRIETLGHKHWRCVGIAMDITDLKRIQEQLKHQILLAKHARAELEMDHRELAEDHAKLEVLAMLDGLTGLKNYRAFKERLTADFQTANQNGAALSLIMVDLDRFKQYNDTYGHLAGDDVMKMSARILAENARDVDCVARYGGEEFAVILPTGKEAAMVVAHRLRLAFEQTAWPKRLVTASFGVATLEPPSYLTISALIADADRALYCSKAHGRNRVTHASDASAGEAGELQRIAINCGGDYHWPFIADTHYRGGRWAGTGMDCDQSAVDLDGAPGPVSPEVYQTERYGDFAYIIPGFAPGTACLVRLHFAEMFYNQPSVRRFNVAINGAAVLTNFDIFVEAGGSLRAIARKFAATADGDGKITIVFTSMADNALINAIEILW